MRIGLSSDELLAATWATGASQRYVLQTPELNVLEGETLALVGDGARALLGRLASHLPDALPLDGAVAAAGGALRIHAQQAARVGLRVLIIDEPLPAPLTPAARTLAIADLAGVADLGLTTLVVTGDAVGAARFADRVGVVDGGRPVVTYPVLAPGPRSAADVAPVLARVRARLAVA